ncbi:MAG TPA: class I SAM-dependent methyltransferase [Ignavibacteriaceae bacterium]|nr:class I SAM-dependent methyltransferase [Ignavibacteriaceae bacterium]
MHAFELVNRAFSNQSHIFDSYEEGNDILKWMRSVTRGHLLRHLKIGANILELNAGTGHDAVFLGKKGFKIHCIDIAEGMIDKLNEKIINNDLREYVSFQQLSFTELQNLDYNSFDHIFSNFGGLNCTNDVSRVFQQFKKILKPGGKVTLVIIPPVCPWEIALLFKGKFRTAFRRLHKNGTIANVEGVSFRTHYYNPKQIIKALGNKYKLLELQGVASLSPPPYMEKFPRRFPGTYRILSKIDSNISHIFPFNRCADHFIITAEFKN